MCDDTSNAPPRGEENRQVDANWDRFIKLMLHMTWNDGTGGIAGDHGTDEGLAASMERWNAQVKADVPADQLLVWEPADGWEPLCEFLEVSVPDQPLPHANDRDTFSYRVTNGALATLQAWHEARPVPA